MHLGNGAITTECVVLTYGAATAGLVAGAAAIRRSGLTREKLETAAALGCAVLAVQAVNVPLGFGTSGHLVGGVLLASVLGPGLGAWTMALVLAIQALAFGDGGLAALGANLLNMALVPAGLMALMKRGRASASALGMIAGASILVAASLIVVEIALFRSATELRGWTTFAATMLTMHAWIGLFEGLATALISAGLARLAESALSIRSVRRGLAALALVAIVASLMIPLPTLADGYESAAQSSGLSWLLR